MELLIFSRKQPSWYIIFVKLVSYVSPASPDATIISVKMLSGPGALFGGIPYRENSNSLLVTGVNSFSVCICGIFPLLS